MTILSVQMVAHVVEGSALANQDIAGTCVKYHQTPAGQTHVKTRPHASVHQLEDSNVYAHHCGLADCVIYQLIHVTQTPVKMMPSVFQMWTRMNVNAEMVLLVPDVRLTCVHPIHARTLADVREFQMDMTVGGKCYVNLV